MPELMTCEEAWQYAATWGSLMRSGDPGWCMYGFSENFLMQSEDHRAQCIAWIEEQCRPQVIERPEDYDDNELEQMDAFLVACKNAELAA